MVPAVLLGIAAWIWLPWPAVQAIQSGTVLGAIIGAASIFAGFFSTGMTILLALEGSPVMQLLDDLQMRHRVNDSIWGATQWLLALAGISLLALIVNAVLNGETRPGAGVVAAMTIGASLAAYRAVRLIAAILRRHEVEAPERRAAPAKT